MASVKAQQGWNNVGARSQDPGASIHMGKSAFGSGPESPLTVKHALQHRVWKKPVWRRLLTQQRWQNLSTTVEEMRAALDDLTASKM